MGTLTKKGAAAPRITGTEIFILTVLIAAGSGGGFIAQQNLAALTAEAKLHGMNTGAAGGAGPAADESTRSSALDAASPEAATTQEAVASEPVAPRESANSPSALPVRTQSLQVLSDLVSRKVLASNGVPPIAAGRAGQGPAFAIGTDGKLPGGFGQLFGLGEAEIASLQDSLSSIKQQVDATVAASTNVQETGPDAYSITVNPSPDGPALRDQFESALRGALGDDRYRAFALLNGEQETPAGRGPVVGPLGQVRLTGVAAMFGGFGVDSKTITISKTNGRYTYQVRSGTMNGGGNGAMDLSTLEARLGPAIKQLPPGF